MHIIHDWCLNYLTGAYVCYNCSAMITNEQLFSCGSRILDIQAHCDEMWNLYKSHGLNGYILTNRNPEKVLSMQWKVKPMAKKEHACGRIKNG